MQIIRPPFRQTPFDASPFFVNDSDGLDLLGAPAPVAKEPGVFHTNATYAANEVVDIFIDGAGISAAITDNYNCGNLTGLVNVDLQVVVYKITSAATYQPNCVGYYDPGNSPGVCHVASAVAALHYSANPGPANLSPQRPLCLRATMPATTGTYMLGTRVYVNSPSRYHCNFAYWMSGASKKV